MSPTLSVALQILIAVESNGNPKAFNAEEQAIGLLQIRPVMVQEVNRILEKAGDARRFEHADAWDTGKSIAMAAVYLEHWGTEKNVGRKPRIIDYALLWCAGPDGPRQPPTAETRRYVARVREKALLYMKFIEAEQLEAKRK